MKLNAIESKAVAVIIGHGLGSTKWNGCCSFFFILKFLTFAVW
jgi:hypothetical protein